MLIEVYYVVTRKRPFPCLLSKLQWGARLSELLLDINAVSFGANIASDKIDWELQYVSDMGSPRNVFFLLI